MSAETEPVTLENLTARFGPGENDKTGGIVPSPAPGGMVAPREQIIRAKGKLSSLHFESPLFEISKYAIYQIIFIVSSRFWGFSD